MATLETLFARSVSRETLALRNARKRRLIGEFRLLPMVILGAGILLGVKVSNIAIAADAALDKQAEKAAPGPALAAAPIPEAKPQPIVAKTKPDAPVNQPSAEYMSKSEIDLLQDLVARRQQLEQRAGQLDTRERLLMATEQRIDKKIERLKAIEAEIKDLLRLHDSRQEAQIQTLVRVYENMKPKEAAIILEKLEMDILISVVEKMKDRKVASVLAAMKPDVAKALTVELATRKKLPEITG